MQCEKSDAHFMLIAIRIKLILISRVSVYTQTDMQSKKMHYNEIKFNTVILLCMQYCTANKFKYFSNRNMHFVSVSHKSLSLFEKWNDKREKKPHAKIKANKKRLHYNVIN